MQLTGLHHVTAITGQAPQNLAFYTQVLGMRLVKKTVNQDDVSAYHLFYADKYGSPGTDVTFFDWPNVAPNRPGTGSISRVALRVAGKDSLAWWAQRLSQAGVPHSGVTSENGQPQIHFSDPEGLELALLDDGDSPGAAPGGTPWEGAPVPLEHGIRGMHSVTLLVSDLRPMETLLTGVMGFTGQDTYQAEDDPARRVTVFQTGPGGPGSQVHVEVRPGQPGVRLGRGGVHHVALRVPDDEAQLAWRQRIAAAGLNVTPVIDRFYFKSIYFRVPEGILFEIATDGPGFQADEDPAQLGQRLALPPFLEPQREMIEAGLRPLQVPQ